MSNFVSNELALTRKEELAIRIGMQFDEVAETFSEETLNSMQMMHTVGGDGGVNIFCNITFNWTCLNLRQCKCPTDEPTGQPTGQPTDEPTDEPTSI